MSSFNNQFHYWYPIPKKCFVRRETDFDFHLDSYSWTKSWERKSTNATWVESLWVARQIFDSGTLWSDDTEGGRRSVLRRSFGSWSFWHYDSESQTELRNKRSGLDHEKGTWVNECGRRNVKGIFVEVWMKRKMQMSEQIWSLRLTTDTLAGKKWSESCVIFKDNELILNGFRMVIELWEIFFMMSYASMSLSCSKSGKRCPSVMCFHYLLITVILEMDLQYVSANGRLDTKRSTRSLWLVMCGTWDLFN